MGAHLPAAAQRAFRKGIRRARAQTPFMRLVRFAIDGRIKSGTIEDDSAVAGGERWPLARVKLLAPCVPSKIIGVGRNYADHEAELAVVIGKRCHGVPKSQAFDVVAGYTVCNDVTARDLQESDGQWARAKGFDTFAPLGPWIVTGLDPAALRVRTSLNGTLRQDCPTSKLIFDVPTLIEYISAAFTLEPGDVIATGTPSGIGPMQRGDQVSVEIAGIGTLTNRVV